MKYCLSLLSALAMLSLLFVFHVWMARQEQIWATTGARLSFSHLWCLDASKFIRQHWSFLVGGILAFWTILAIVIPDSKQDKEPGT